LGDLSLSRSAEVTTSAITVEDTPLERSEFSRKAQGCCL
jgi:hypothetical protein